MKKIIALVGFIAIVVILLIIPREGLSAGGYGQILCHEQGFTCFKVPQGENWNTLFPDESQRNFVMRLNRINENVHPGMIIAIPENLDSTDIMQYSPFDKQIGPQDKKTVIVDPKKLAWGAYDESGNLMRWGPASLGRAWCPDTGAPCRTKTGTFYVYSKGSENCVSSIFPIPNGGAPMPYCMFFNRGQAMHGSYDVVGYNASHGCVRLFVEDAQWLSKNFVEKGTKVIIQPYAT